MPLTTATRNPSIANRCELLHYQGDRWIYWHRTSARTGCIRKVKGDRTEHVFYFQFSTEAEARQFWTWSTGEMTSRAELRRSKRFESGYEVKVWGSTSRAPGFPRATFERLVQRDRARAESVRVVFNRNRAEAALAA